MFDRSGLIILPGPLHRRIDELVQSFLQPRPTIDFSMPPGEPALTSPDSVSWRIFKNPVSVFIGGVAAVLFEFAEPRVRDGVWQHSRFRTDPLSRLQRTGLAAMVTVYGPRSASEAMIAKVVARHQHVAGRTGAGEPYCANDPALLNWVQATAGYCFMQAYQAYVRPLTRAERRALFVEALPAARLYGATGAPASEEDREALFRAMRSRLVASPIIFEFLAIMEQVPLMPIPTGPFQRILLKAAVEILPGWVRERLGLGPAWSLGSPERVFVNLLAGAGERLVLRSSPAVQACRRLGLPDTHLYRVD